MKRTIIALIGIALAILIFSLSVFSHVTKKAECTKPLEPKEESTKKYCASIGLVDDDGAKLVNYTISLGPLDVEPTRR